ncbi:putative flap endonuclease-1-like 5' DNA nuclease [Catalinimonas alkaloidigena]|uniref:hypothetical protein n=1 Tax=Catalinimonas alkaloidigena TaxID=1075417 RepID=UPI002405FC8A|nr:hypothetical protein [Catalinimonas alkaloidigena]MDF9798089.1 putative flap endonuclease-1-like 5' DNA nuclease [Catalinimonas alkaloidigena]
MSRLILKIIATLAGLGILLYIMGRNIKVWELEVVEAQTPTSPEPPPKAQKKKKNKTKAAAGDDLKKIKGVGPVLERKLKAIGLTTYEHIAELTRQDIEKIEEKLNGFSGRIERDHWIEQAKQLNKKDT